MNTHIASLGGWARWLPSLFFIVFASWAHAAPIEVNNHSFEQPPLGAGGWSNDLPVAGGDNDQWTDPIDGTPGNRFIEYIGGFFSEGNQHIGTAAGHFIYQNLGVPYEPNTAYTLTVGVGYRNAGQSGTNSVSVIGLTALGDGEALQGTDTANQLEIDSLLAANVNQVDSVALNNATERTFTDVTLEFVTDDNPPAGNIVIFLGDDNEGNRSHFDNVRLDFLTALDPDGDQIPAEWETGTDRGVARNLDPNADDGGEDPDGDTLTNFQEYELGSHPRLADTDGDGLNDNFEANTDPLNPDVDGDTLLDGEEIATYGTDPNDTDSDDDTFEDQAEVAAGTDPLDANSVPARGGAIRVGGSFVGGNATSDGAEVGSNAGVAEQGSWTNLPGGSGGPTILSNAEGEPSLMRVSWKTNGPEVVGDDPGNDGNDQMMHGILLSRGTEAGGDNLPSEFTVQNIAYPLYDLYLYLNANDPILAAITVNDQTIMVDEVSPFDGTFDEATEDGIGNYIHLKNLTGSSMDVVVWGAGVAGFQIDRLEPADPSLLAIPESVDFGVYDGNPGPLEATIRMLNPGLTQTLTISDTAISGDQASNFTVSGVPASLGPNEGADVVVTFNPSDAVGIYRGFLEVTSNDAVTGMTRIPLVGQIKHANGLVAHYKMDESAGDVLEDASGNGFHGRYVSGSGSVNLGADSLIGEGTAVRFEEGGDAAYAEIPEDAGFPILAEGSYAFWVQQDAADIGSPSVLFSRASSPANPYAVFFEQATGGPDAVTWISEAASETLTSEPFIVPDEIFHVVYTYSDSNEDALANVAVYVNGELNASAQETTGYPLNTIAPFQIGASAGAFGWTGSIDDFQIYERVLTAEQVADMYANPGSVAEAVEPPSPLVGYWNLDEGAGDQAADYQNAALTGTVMEGEWVAGHTGVDGDQAVALSGVDGGTSIVEVPALNQTFTEITITGWVNGVPTGNWSGIIQSRDGTQPIGLGYRADSGELTYTWNDNNANTYNFVSGLAIPENEWTFVALRVTPDAGTLYVGAAGQLNSAVNAIPHAEQMNPTVWHFGKDNCCDTTRNFQGAIDDVAIFSQALTDDQIQAIFDGTSPTDVFSTGGGGGGGETELLVNGSFEEPVLNNINTNNLGTVPTGWSQTGDDATWNLIRNDGSAYSSGVDNAADGSQILDLNGIFEIYQNFTITEASDIRFGASFSNREGHDGSEPSTVGIYDAAGTMLLSPEVSVDTSADPTPSDVWRSGEATATGLAPGEYQIRIALNNFNNVDAVFALASPAGGGRSGAVAQSNGPITESVVVDFGDLSGDSSYEFSFNAIKAGASTAIAGNDTWGLKLDQWNEQGIFGTTEFGVADNLFEGDNVASVFDRDVHVLVVNDTGSGSTLLYIDGALAGSWAGNIALTGDVRLMGARIESPVDLFGEGSVMHGWAVYDSALSAEDAATLASTPFSNGGGGGSDPGTIGSVTVGAGGVTLALPAGGTFDVEYSADLVTWEIIASDVSGDYADGDAGRTGLPAGYYRGVAK